MQIVGRHNELTRLREAAVAALDGRGQLVLIGGETGIGKTMLVEQFRDEIAGQGFQFLVGAAYEAPIAVPFGVWTELLRDLSGQEGLPAPPRELRDAAVESLSESRTSLFHDVTTFLHDLSDRTPAMLVFEDLHWADRASLDLLRYVARQLAAERLLIIGTYRIEGLQDTPLYQCLPHLVREGPTERIQLHRLVTGDVRRLIDDRYAFDTGDTDRLAGYLQSLADGNPLFIEELLRTLEGERTIRQENDGWRLGELGEVIVPMLVQQLIDSRLEGTDRRISEALAAAAVLGNEVSLEDWAQVLNDRAVLDPAVEHVLRVRVMREVPGTVSHMRFTHSIVRQAIYAQVLPTTRQRLHLAAAELLASRPGTAPGMVAHHYEQAGKTEQAITWLVRAGDRASDVHAYESAVEHFSRVLELAGGSGQDVAIRAFRSRGRAFNLLGEFEAARDDLEAALRLSRSTPDRDTAWRILLDLGFLWTERDYAEADSYLRQALDLAREIGSDQLIGASLNRVGNLRTNDDRPREAIELHLEALEIFESQDDAAGIAETLDFLGVAHYLHGDLIGSARYYREALRCFREINDLHGQASALPNLMLNGGSYDADAVVVAPGSTAEWLRYGEQGLATAIEAGWRSGEVYARIHIGYVQTARGMYGPALTNLEQGLALAQQIGHRQWQVAGEFSLGMALSDLLQAEEARERLERAHATAHEIRSRYWIRASSAALADVLLAVGDVERAGQVLARVLDQDSPMDSLGIRPCWMRQAQLMLVRDNPEAALDILDRLIATVSGDVQDPRVPQIDGMRGRALTQLGRSDEAEKCYRLALHRAEEIDLPSVCWRIWGDLARHYRVTGARDAALDARMQGRELLNRLAGSIEDDDLRTRFLGAVPAEFVRGDNDDLSGDPFGLSKREREVLQVASEGLTDGEIGQRLSISPRTVGRHLQSIYTKLGVNSRTAAVARAFEHHLIDP